MEPPVSPSFLRRQVLRATRYAANTRALQLDTVPPEGPFDVALTNGLLAAVAASEPDEIWSARGGTKPARALLEVAAGLGLDVDVSVLDEGLDLTQPLRHGTADDEWITVGKQHVEALVALDELDGLQVLNLAELHPTVERLVVAVYEERVSALIDRRYPSPDEALDAPTPEECDECWRHTFIPLGFDASGGTAVPGFCLACGYERDYEQAWGIYMREEWDRGGWEDA